MNLQRFTQGLGVRIHQRLHASQSIGSCGFNPAAHVALAPVDAASLESWTPCEAMRGWARDFGQAFARAHQRPAVERAKDRLRADLAERVSLADAARHAGCSVSALHRLFAQESGDTPGQFRTRIRAAKAIDRLRTTDWKAEAVARDVGWKSKKDLYRALTQLTGLTPATLRSLSRADVDKIVARLGDTNERLMPSSAE